MLAGKPDQPWNHQETDAEGRFEITGLDAREYTLDAMDPETLVRTGKLRAQAGARDVELALPADAFWKRVAGRVLSRSGEPLAGVSVSPMCDTFRLSYEGAVLSTWHSSIEGTVTDERGHFELEHVPRELVYLRLDGEESVPVEYGRHVEGGLGELSRGRLQDLEITVPLRVRLRVLLAAPGEADAVAVLDENGERITINVFEARGRHESPTVRLSEGRSEVLTITDSATTLVLLRGEDEVRRVPLTLVRGVVNEIRP